MELKMFGGLPSGPQDGGREQAGKPQAGLLDIARLSAEGALTRLESSLEGLLDREAEERLEQYGENAVAHEQHKSAPRQLLEHFATPLSLLLLGLATVSFLTGEIKGAVVIAIMVVLSGLLSFIQEFRSSKAAEKLREMVSTTASVLRKDVTAGVPDEVNRLFQVKLHIRPSHTTEVPLSQVVPGDIVHLSAGDMIPADVRILSAKDLFVNQAALTGEAMPKEKFFGPASRDIKSVLELPNICFMGTNVVCGTSVAVVVATGSRTYFGSIASAVAGLRLPTSFDLGINNFTWLMIRFMLVMVPLVFLINGLTKDNWMRGAAVRTGRGGRPHAGDAADDRHHQPGQGRHGHVAQEGHRQAPQLHPELRRDGRAVHRQDRHAHPGPGDSREARRCRRQRKRARAANTPTSTATTRPD